MNYNSPRPSSVKSIGRLARLEGASRC